VGLFSVQLAAPIAVDVHCLRASGPSIFVAKESDGIFSPKTKLPEKTMYVLRVFVKNLENSEYQKFQLPIIV